MPLQLFAFVWNFFLFFRSLSFTPLAHSLLCLFHCFISVGCLSPSFLHFAYFFPFHVYDVMQPTIQKQSVRFSIDATRFLFFPNRFLKKGSSIHRTTTLSFICMIRYTDFQNENYRYFFRKHWASFDHWVSISSWYKVLDI